MVMTNTMRVYTKTNELGYVLTTPTGFNAENEHLPLIVYFARRGGARRQSRGGKDPQYSKSYSRQIPIITDCASLRFHLSAPTARCGIT